MELEWIHKLFLGQGVAHSVLILGLVATLGIMLGHIRIGRVSLGVTMVLFVGILAGHLGMDLEHEVLHFVREFGLILFVYAVGLQVGNGFFSSLRKGGIRLNSIAVGIVLLGVLMTVALYYATGLPMPTMVGILSGAVTNTPGLGAAQNAYADLPGAVPELAASIPLGYAVTYPLGVVGIILAIMLVRILSRVDVKQEEERLRAVDASEPQVDASSFEITNPNLAGLTIAQVMQSFVHGNVVISRHWSKQTSQITVASDATVLQLGDRIFAIATSDCLDTLQPILGPRIQMDRKQWIPNDAVLVSESYTISNRSLTGRRLGELQLRQLYGVNATRIHRAGLSFVPDSRTRLQVGDRVTCVGSDVTLVKVKELFGDSSKHLNEPNLIGIFLGIALGVFFGSLPFAIPGIPQPVKLGLAGGPLIVAILLSRFGTQLHLTTYTTQSANLMLRELGISLFLACVGLSAGGGFVDSILSGGYVWIGYGFLITILPLLIMGYVGKRWMGVNYLTLSGVMAGSMTDPPALAYSNTLTEGDAPAVGYATVYPLTMFLRVLTAQLLILIFCS